MREIIAAFTQIFVCVYMNSDSWVEERTLLWTLTILFYYISSILLKKHSWQKDEKICLILGLATFALFSGFLLSYCSAVDHWIIFLATALVDIIVAVLQFCPPLYLDNHGLSGNFRLLHGFLLVMMSSMVLTGKLSFRLVLDMVPSHLSWQTWGLIKECRSSRDDTKKSIVSTAIILGKHGCFKMIVLFCLFSDLYIAIDMASYSISRGLPLLLIPWQIRISYKLKYMKIGSLSAEAFAYMIVFNALIVLGIAYK
ncbi:unnamed protein product [Blepharisma stoltei]|uniref:Uncharacterized protein n=1 Tax=Blepharisma stoltei TaxID=1481888 RepID=A0AAU9I968_9CILI|nr:unnamed protein product [Blepharisma stoltei]